MKRKCQSNTTRKQQTKFWKNQREFSYEKIQLTCSCHGTFLIPYSFKEDKTEIMTYQIVLLMIRYDDKMIVKKECFNVMLDNNSVLLSNIT